MYIEPTQEATAAFFGNLPQGQVVMLNLLRFREVADYTRSPQLAPEAPISGEQAYMRYAANTTPMLEAAGGELIYRGVGGAYLIGPADERWDLVLLVRYPSAQVFMAMVTNKDYLAGVGHRTAALSDSRLLPMTNIS